MGTKNKVPNLATQRNNALKKLNAPFGNTRAQNDALLKKNNLGNLTTKSNTTGSTTKEKKSALSKFATKHKNSLKAIEKIGEGASALDPLTDSGNRPGSTGSALGDKGADINPYTVVRGESDILSAKERKRLKSLNA